MDKRCEEIRDLMIESLMVGAPDERRAEIDRHLEGCPACRDYLKGLRGEEERLARLAASVQPSIDRIESGVMDALDRSALDDRVVELPVRRAKVMARIMQIAAAAVIVAAAVWAAARYTGIFSGGTPAFAAVLEKIEKAHSVVYRQSLSLEGAAPSASDVMINENGIRRTEFQGGQVIINDFNRGLDLNLMPNTKEAFLDRWVGLPRGRGLFNYVEWIRDVHKESGTFVRRDTIDGKKANVFLVEISDYNKRTVWADAETDLPLRIEESILPNPNFKFVVPMLTLKLSDFGGRGDLSRTITLVGGHGQNLKMDMVYDNFQWNAPFDESLFSLTPPKGYTVRQSRLDGSNKGEKDLTDALAAWAGMSGGSFPLKIEDLSDSNLVRPMLKGKFDKNGDPYKELDSALQEGDKLLKGLRFAQETMAQGEWHYAPDGAKLGDAKKPICWWKSAGADTYRVVYGDLTVKDEKPSAVKKLN
jgi:hypothetical protein